MPSSFSPSLSINPHFYLELKNVKISDVDSRQRVRTAILKSSLCVADPSAQSLGASRRSSWLTLQLPLMVRSILPAIGTGHSQLHVLRMRSRCRVRHNDMYLVCGNDTTGHVGFTEAKETTHVDSVARYSCAH